MIFLNPGDVVTLTVVILILVYFLVCYLWAMGWMVCWIHNMFAGIRARCLLRKEEKMNGTKALGILILVVGGVYVLLGGKEWWLFLVAGVSIIAIGFLPEPSS